ncbi:acyl-CoA thioesterase [Actomonas aquatica]|uniref:Thioesterase family protein n=1 Tax=Actomonas aquatica TaxID=2866162 RepID=A0ABZ1CAI1_9BACT|nr:thioesterase family protein [Opitutus sp. WL0086]WRQ88609.1 thioesterase family protein [Opitutus sp. WL0086]
MGRPFTYSRTIHFPDTDAAGVVFFARYLSIVHEAYEESLAAAGLPLATFFADHGVVVPIAKSEASYLRPLLTGDRIEVELTPTRLSEHSFALEATLWKQISGTRKRAAVTRTEHVCIHSTTRERLALPDALATWVDAS